MLFKNIAEPYHAGAIIALAALEVINDCLGNEEAFFKWPNDIYIKSAKLAGILSEGVIEHGRFAAIISGVGINVNQTSFPSSLPNPTSILLETAPHALSFEGALPELDLELLLTQFYSIYSGYYYNYLSHTTKVRLKNQFEKIIVNFVRLN